MHEDSFIISALLSGPADGSFSTHTDRRIVLPKAKNDWFKASLSWLEPEGTDNNQFYNKSTKNNSINTLAQIFSN